MSPGRAEAHAEDARSALTRRLARSYLRPDIAPSHRACAVHSRESTSVPSRLSSAAPPLSAEPTGLNPPTPVSGEPDYDAIVWWHNHFRAKFLAAMRCHGNRWMLDRENVTAVGWMLAERAIRHAAGRESIDIDAARRAAADVERHCAIHAKKAGQVGELDAERSRLAGYWCLRYPR